MEDNCDVNCDFYEEHDLLKQMISEICFRLYLDLVKES